MSSLKGGPSGASPVSFLQVSVISQSKFLEICLTASLTVGQVDVRCTVISDENRGVMWFT